MKLIELWENIRTTGVFSHIDMSWWEGFDAETANIDYYINYSGNKSVSPLLTNFTYGNKLTDIDKKIISTVVSNHYLNDWKRLYNAIYSDYNPINNYDMLETETTNGETGNTSKNENTNKTTTSVENATNDKMYGFNSVNASNKDDVISTGKQSEESENINNTTINATQKNNRELKRSGNIGVTTSQQMIESEIELRKNNLLSIIFNDIDKILTIQCY
jgi:hypothetical protein